MGDQPLTVVVDANVALKLFFEQPGSDRADGLFAHLAADARARAYVPDFFYVECASAFTIYVRQTDYPAEAARRDLTELLALALHVVPSADLATEALDLAMTHSISGYDAFYLALSQRVSAPLVTADEKLVRALGGGTSRAFLLERFELPQLPES